MSTKVFKKNISSINGLILIGGKSSRMGNDKSKINYHGKKQDAYLFDVLSKFINPAQIYYSVRNGKQETKKNSIKDQYTGFGPFGAICSAFKSNPNTAWLVIAVDLPFVDKNLIKLLISKRNSSKIATTFKGKNKDFPEPLITIWEPKAYPILQQYLAEKKLSLITVLKKHEVEIVEIDEKLIQNINTKEEYNRIKKTHL